MFLSVESFTLLNGGKHLTRIKFYTEHNRMLHRVTLKSTDTYHFLMLESTGPITGITKCDVTYTSNAL